MDAASIAPASAKHRYLMIASRQAAVFTGSPDAAQHEAQRNGAPLIRGPRISSGPRVASAPLRVRLRTRGTRLGHDGLRHSAATAGMASSSSGSCTWLGSYSPSPFPTTPVAIQFPPTLVGLRPIRRN